MALQAPAPLSCEARCAPGTRICFACATSVRGWVSILPRFLPEKGETKAFGVEFRPFDTASLLVSRSPAIHRDMSRRNSSIRESKSLTLEP